MIQDDRQKQYSGFERRKYFRYQLLYSPRDAKISIDGREYKILDISREGIRIEVDKKASFAQQIEGTVVFSDGTTQQIKGGIVWMQDGEIGLKLAAPCDELTPGDD